MGMGRVGRFVRAKRTCAVAARMVSARVAAGAEAYAEVWVRVRAGAWFCIAGGLYSSWPQWQRNMHALLLAPI